MKVFRRDGGKPSFWDFYPQKVDEMRILWLKGVPAAAIAKQLSPLGEITRCSVIGKARRLGLLQHKHSTRLNMRPKPPAKPKPQRRHRLHILPEVMREEPIMTFSENPTNLRDLPFERPATAVSLFDAKPHHCRWPVGEPREFLFCGEVAVPEGKMPYCLGHYRRAISHSMRTVANAGYIPFHR